MSTLIARIPRPRLPEGIGVLLALVPFAVLIGVMCAIGWGVFAVGMVAALAATAYILAEPEKSALALIFTLPFMVQPVKFGDFYLSLTVPLGYLIGVSLLLRCIGSSTFRLPRLYAGFAVLLLIITAVSAFASVDWLQGMSRLVYVLLFVVFGAGVGTAVASRRMHQHQIITVFVAGAAVAAIALTAQSLAQFALGEARVTSWLRDMMPIFWGSTTGGLNWRADGVDILRAIFPFMTPGLAGQYMAMALVAALWLMFNPSERTTPRARNLLLLSIGLTAIALVLTVSRQSYIGAGVGVLVVVLMSGRSRLFALALPFVLAALFLPTPGSTGTVFEYFAATPDSKSGTDRIYLWGEAVNLWERNPMIGIGPGLYGDVRKGGGPVYAHNTYLDRLVETGSIGAAVFVAYALTLLMAAWRRRATLAFAVLVTWAVANFFDDSFYAPKTSLILAMAIALIAVPRQEARGAGSATRGPPERSDEPVPLLVGAAR